MAQFKQGLFSSIHVLNIGRSDFGQHQQPHTVDNQGPFASIDQLSTIKTAFFTAFGAFDRLTVQNHQTGLSFFVRFLAHSFAGHFIQLIPQANSLKQTKISINGLPGWQIMRQGSPYTAIFEHIEDRIQDLSPAILARSSGGFRFGHLLLNCCPFGIIKISRVILVWFYHQPNLPDFLLNVQLFYPFV